MGGFTINGLTCIMILSFVCTHAVLQAADGLSCEQIMNTGGTVTVLCIDNLHGLIVAAVKNTIK